jgi:hypothetical protein
MRIFGFLVIFLSVICGSTQTGAQQPQPVAACLTAASMYRATNTGVRSGDPFSFYDLGVNSNVTAVRSVPAPGMIDLAWGPDFALYGVTNNQAQSASERNSLYRIDPTTGTPTLLGPITGLSPSALQDGDLTTFSYTGRIYGVDGNRFFSFPMPGGTASPVAQMIAQLNIPAGWSLVGLASSDAPIRFYAIAEPPANSPAPARLLSFGPNGMVYASVDLPSRVGSLGALEWVAGKLLFAEGV